MKTAFALIHVLALGTCFVVQLGAPEVSRMPGVRRALQTLEENSAVRERIGRETGAADRFDDDRPIEQAAILPGTPCPAWAYRPTSCSVASRRLAAEFDILRPLLVSFD
jgi:hypothetical protein